jgi:hypothetical protein
VARGSLAGPSRGAYLALVAWLAFASGCRRAPPPLAPEGAVFSPLSAEAFAAAAAPTVPAAPELLALRWRFRDPQSEVAGRGAVRVSPPDSLRVDVRGPLGFGRATLVVAGDESWADPPELVRQVLPRRFLLWAMLGVVRAPDSAMRREAFTDGARRLLRVAEPDGLVTTFELRDGRLTGVAVAREAGMVARLTFVRDVRGALVRADAEDLERNARLSFDIQSRTSGVTFPAEVWRHP